MTAQLKSDYETQPVHHTITWVDCAEYVCPDPAAHGEKCRNIPLHRCLIYRCRADKGATQC